MVLMKKWTDSDGDNNYSYDESSIRGVTKSAMVVLTVVLRSSDGKENTDTENG